MMIKSINATVIAALFFATVSVAGKQPYSTYPGYLRSYITHRGHVVKDDLSADALRHVDPAHILVRKVFHAKGEHVGFGEHHEGLIIELFDTKAKGNSSPFETMYAAFHFHNDSRVSLNVYPSLALAEKDIGGRVTEERPFQEGRTLASLISISNTWSEDYDLIFGPQCQIFHRRAQKWLRNMICINCGDHRDGCSYCKKAPKKQIGEEFKQLMTLVLNQENAAIYLTNNPAQINVQLKNNNHLLKIIDDMYRHDVLKVFGSHCFLEEMKHRVMTVNHRLINKANVWNLIEVWETMDKTNQANLDNFEQLVSDFPKTITSYEGGYEHQVNHDFLGTLDLFAKRLVKARQWTSSR